MPIDLKTEQLISLSEAAKTLPRTNGKKVHDSTLWRWARKGIRGVKLEYVRVGSRICTSVEALSRFLSALTVKDDEVAASDPDLTSSHQDATAFSSRHR